jgi:molybdenum cofactor cytidylyltransferase
MMDAYRTSGKKIVALAYQGRRASPTLFDRSLFGALREITGDEGGRSIVRAHPRLLELVEVEDELTLLDVDTPEDWQRLAINGPETDKRTETDAETQ